MEDIRFMLEQVLANQQELLKRLERIEWRLAPKVADPEKKANIEESSIPLEWIDNPDLKAEELWKQVLDQVAEKIPQRSFVTWFRPARGLRIQDDVLYVYSTNEFSAEWLASRYGELVDSLLQEITDHVKCARFVS
jgi:hypothetical protein